MMPETVYICRRTDDTVGFREGFTLPEILSLCPDIVEAYPLSESQEREVEAAWRAYWDHSREIELEPRARELLAAVMRNVFKRAKEAAGQEEKKQ